MCVCLNFISTYHALCIQRENNVRNLFSTLRQCKGSSQTECSKHMFVRKPFHEFHEFHETLASESNAQHVNKHTRNPKAPTPKEETPHHTKNSVRNNHCNAHRVHSIPKSAPTTSNTKTNHSPSSSAWGTTTLCTTRKKRER